MINKNSYLSFILGVLAFVCGIIDSQAQQDPQYTQYMYNTMTVNPAYAGSSGNTIITGLARSQWIGVDGAPDTQTLSYDTSLGYRGVGLGFNLVNDKIGPSRETSLDVNISYGIQTSGYANLAFGLKLGGGLLNVDWSKGSDAYSSEGKGVDPVFLQNINNRFLPTLGAGVYYYKPKWYLGFAIPNFLESNHYNVKLDNVKDLKGYKGYSFNNFTAEERFHLFVISGYVFDLSENVKFKPASLLKVVRGSSLSLDVSANFLFNSKFCTGVSWRWDDSVSALLGFQVTESLNIGYAYDFTTSSFGVSNDGTHEIMVRYNIFSHMAIKSPRFF